MPKGDPNGGRPEEWTIERSIELAQGLSDWMATPEAVFWQEFLLTHQLNKDQLGILQRKFKERQAKLEAEQKTTQDAERALKCGQELKKIRTFFRLIKSSQEMQELKLAKLSLDNRSVGGAIFLLKNHHGYADKQEVKQETRQINVDAAQMTSKSLEELLRLQEELSSEA